MLTSAGFGITSVMYLLTATIAGYALTEFSADHTQAGILAGLFVLGACLGRLTAGWALESFGERTTAAFAFSSYLVCSLLYFVVRWISVLYVLRTLHGIGYGLAASAVAGAVMRAVPASRRGEGSGWFSTGTSLGSGIAPFLGLTLAALPGGYFWVFSAASAFSVIAGLLSLLAWDYLTGRPRKPTSIKSEPTIGLAKWVEPRALPIGTVVACLAACWGVVMAFLAEFARENELQNAAAWFFVVYAAVVLITRPVGGVLQDRLGDDRIFLPILVAAGLGMVVIGVAHTPLVLLAGAAIMGASYGTALPVGQASAVRIAGSLRAGMAVSSYYLVVDAVNGLAPAIFGGFISIFGYRTTFVSSAALAVVALGLYTMWARRIGKEFN